MTFDQVSLYFDTSDAFDVPATLKVQYWDGFRWADAKGQKLVKASESNQETSIAFDAVVSSSVRVFMESAFPYQEESGGRMRITKFEVSQGPKSQ
jgi:hypothetical protein